jgi:hypothetical protein
LSVTSSEVPISAGTAIHIVPMPSSTGSKNTSLMPMLRAIFTQTVAIVARLKPIAKGNCRKSSLIRVASAVSMAWLLPPCAPPTLMPTLAIARGCVDLGVATL